MARRGRNAIAESFIAHTKEMRESWPWRLLPDNARRVLDRLEVEHMRNGGAENGKLVCTYSQFEEWGLRRQSIALAIRQAVALRFLEIPRKGFRTSAEFRAPSLYRLTYVHSSDAKLLGGPTHDWRRFKHERDAREALERAASKADEARAEWRAAKERRARTRVSGCANATKQGAKSPPKRPGR